MGRVVVMAGTYFSVAEYKPSRQKLVEKIKCHFLSGQHDGVTPVPEHRSLCCY